VIDGSFIHGMRSVAGGTGDSPNVRESVYPSLCIQSQVLAQVLAQALAQVLASAVTGRNNHLIGKLRPADTTEGCSLTGG
jgi:hypothetical protein